MQVQRLSNGQHLTLDPASTLGAGGEAWVYTVLQDSSLVAKVYRMPDKVQAQKLTVMMTHPPDDPMVAHGHISIAWPMDLLCTENLQRQIIGFLMPRVTGMSPLIACYNPSTRRQQWPSFTYRYLLRTAHNLAAAVRVLHARGYVIGDVNESNILVSDTALVTLVDTDSFQVREPHHGVVYRCPVGKPEFTPPELQGRAFAQVDRAPEHDLFGLAVLIFQLLMEGTHPFAGVYQGRGDPPAYEARIAAGHFPYSKGRHGPYQPMPAALPYALLPLTLQEMFRRCFETGHTHPQARPEAQAWQRALQEVEQTLITCPTNTQHLYSNHLRACPWCERAALLGGRDPFPSRQAIQQRPLPPSPRSGWRPLQVPGVSPPVTPALSRRPLRPSRPPATSLRAVPPLIFPALARPSRWWAVLIAMFWGAVSGGCLSILVYVLMQDSLSAETLLFALWEAVRRAGGSAAWGAMWGAMWGMCRLPAVSAYRPRFRSALTGAMLGLMLGMLTSTCLGSTPGLPVSMTQNALLEALQSAPWHAPLPAIKTLLQAFLVNMQWHAFPGALVGTALGVVWGILQR